MTEKRREFIALLGGAAARAWPHAARTQQATPVIGFLHGGSPGVRLPSGRLPPGPRRSGLHRRQDVTIDYRWVEGQYDRLPAMVADLVQSPGGRDRDRRTARNGRRRKASDCNHPDRVRDRRRSGQAWPRCQPRSARPQRHRSDVFRSGEIGAKRLELLHELAPGATTMACARKPDQPEYTSYVRDIQAAATASELNSCAERPNRRDLQPRSLDWPAAEAAH